MKKILLILIILTPLTFALAQNTKCDPNKDGYCLLEPLPFIETSTGSGYADINNYIQGLVQLTIAVAGGLAVIRIMIGGIQYMTSEAWSGKSDAKNTIQGALFGLLLAITAAGILYVINPSTLNVKLSLAPLSGVTTTINNTLGASGTATAEETGCTDNCAEAPLTINAVPGISCSNTPCYLNADLVNKLRYFREDFGKTGWQIVEAYPPIAGDNAGSCLQEGSGIKPGHCARIGLTTDTSTTTIRKLLNSLKKQFTSYEYDACGSKQTALTSDPGIRADRLVDRIICRSTLGGKEFARVEI